MADNPYKTSVTASRSPSSKDRGPVVVRIIASVMLGGASFFPLLLGVAWIFGGALGLGGRPHRAGLMFVAGIVAASLGAASAVVSARLFLDRWK